MSPFLAELIGTMTLLILGLGVVGGVLLNKSKAQNSGWIVITFGWGLAVAMAIYAVGQYSGAHLNPAVTISFALIGKFPWADVPMYVLAQMIGGILAGAVVFIHYLPHWKQTEDADLKLAVFCNAPAISEPFSNLSSEIIGTFILIMVLLAIGENKFTEGLNPLIVGLFILSIGLSLGGPTGYAINPARDLGPRIAHFLLPIPGKRNSDWNYSWIPVLGPIIGGCYGAVFYMSIFKGEFGLRFFILSSIVLAIFSMAVYKNLKQTKV